MATADIGIRVFLEDAASSALFAISSQLGMLGIAAKTASGGFAGLSASIAGLAVIAGFVVSLFLFGAAIKYSVDQAMALQTSMFGVAVATHVPLAVAMQYTNQLMNLGAQSIFTTAQIADGIGILGRAGFSLQDIMGKTTDGMHGIAAAGVALSIAIRTDAVQGFNILSQVMSAYSVQAKDAMATADLLQFAFEHQTSTVAQFGSGLAQVTPIAHLMGIPLREIVAALDVLGPSMKNTSTACTAMRYTIAGLYQPTAAAQKAMVDLKLATVDAGGNFHSVFFDAKGKAVDFIKAIQILRDHLKGMSQEAQLNALRELFSVRGGQGADILIQKIQAVMLYLGLLEKSHDNAGGAAKRWAEVMKTAAGAIQGFQTSIQDLGAAVGVVLLPFVTQATTWMNNLTSAIRASVLANPQAAAEFLKVGAAVSALGVALGIVLLFILPITQPFMLFAAIIVGVVLGVIGLTAAIMAIIPWWQNFIASASPVAMVLRAIWVAITVVIGVIQSEWASAWAQIVVSFQPLMQYLPLLGTLLLWIAIILGVIIVGVILAVIALLGLFIGALAQFIAGIVSIFSGAIQVIQGVISFFHDFFFWLVGLFTGNRALVEASWSGMGYDLIAIIKGAMAMIGGILQASFGAIIIGVGNFIQTFVGFFTNLHMQLVGGSIIPDMNAKIVASFKGMQSTTTSSTSSWAKDIEGIFSGLADTNTSIASGMAKGVGDAYSRMLLDTKTKTAQMKTESGANATQMANDYISKMHDMNFFTLTDWTSINQHGRTAMRDLKTGVSTDSSNMKDKVTTDTATMGTSVYDAFAGMSTKAVGQFKALADGVVKDIGLIKQALNTDLNNALKLSGTDTDTFQKLVTKDFLKAQTDASTDIKKLVTDAIAALNSLLSQTRPIMVLILALLKSTWATAATDAFTGGANIAKQLAAGIISQYGAIVAAAAGAAARIKANLKVSSPAEEGPMSDIDKWMPNMMRLLASGINQGTPLVQAAAGRAAGGIAASYYAPPTMLSGQGGGYGGNTTIPLVVDGRVLAEVVLNRMTGTLQMNGMGRSFR